MVEPYKAPTWFRRRTYLHFDLPVSHEKAESIVVNPDNVANHAFYPLISYKLLTEKISKSEDDPKVLKKTTKPRQIAYASHIDAHIYSYYAALLSARYEEFLGRNNLQASVLAFRPLGLSNIDFARNAFKSISARHSCAAIGMDVSGFFDNLDHGILKGAWATLLGSASLPEDHYAVFKSITKWCHVDREAVFAEFGISANNAKNGRKRICDPADFRSRVREKGLIMRNGDSFGIPQGSPISAVLSNIYMMDFDIEIDALARRNDGVYFRYCDDILLIVPVLTRENIQKEVAEAIEKLKLSLNKKKTEVRHFRLKADGMLSADKPLQYLGFTYDGQRILIRSAAFARHSKKMKKAVRLAKSTMRRWNAIRASHGQMPKALYRKALYKKYSHLGSRNFITYGHKAARIMGSEAIKDQLRPLWARLLSEIAKA